MNIFAYIALMLMGFGSVTLADDVDCTDNSCIVQQGGDVGK